MVGMILWKNPEKGGGAVTIRERSILRVRFWCAEIARGPHTPEAVLRRRVRSAGKRLRKQGVTRLVLPEQFEEMPQLEKQGLGPASTLGLRKSIAADWVRWLLNSGGRGTAGAKIGVSADRLTGEVVRTVTELALRHRYVLLDLPKGGEELARQLRREYGVSLLLDPSKEQMEEADALVAFDAGGDWESCRMLPLYDETSPLPPLMLPPALEEKLPEGCDRGQLLAVLREQGGLRPGQITVGGGNSAK